MGASVVADVDPGTTGEIRLRNSATGATSDAVEVTSYSGPVIIGWPFIGWGGSSTQFVFVEARRTAGTGGVRLVRAALSLLVDPPSEWGGTLSPTDPGYDTFRTITLPVTKTPTVTPTAADIEHASGGTIYAGGAGTTHVVTSESQWDTVVAAAGPGDIIKIAASIAVPLEYRGDKYGMTGGNGASSGTAGNPIVIMCEGAGEINVSAIDNTVGALSVYAVDHVWCVGVRTRGSQFGIYYRAAEGTSANPFRVAYCDIANTGDAALALAGWYQLVTASSGTAPNGYNGSAAAGLYGFSRHFIVEGCTIDNPGLRTDSSGECIYLGRGSSPGWIAYAANGVIRHNRVTNCKADWIDVKPGCAFIDILDNDFEGGYFVAGAGFQLLYVFSGIDDRPSWYDFDPQIHVEGNRCRNGNLTTVGAGSSKYLAQTSLCGVTFANNEAWGFPNGGVGFRLRSEKAASQSQSTDGEKWVVVNNLFWMDTGLANVGAPASGASPFSASLIDQRNNIGPTGASGVQHTASASDFIVPTAIPTVDTIDASAEYETYGAGSAFELDPGSSLIAAGASISDLTLALDEDIIQRAIPASTPNPGPFQEAA